MQRLMYSKLLRFVEEINTVKHAVMVTVFKLNKERQILMIREKKEKDLRRGQFRTRCAVV